MATSAQHNHHYQWYNERDLYGTQTTNPFFFARFGSFCIYIRMAVLSIILSVILLSVCACVRAFMWFCSQNIVLSLQHNYRILKVLVTLIVFNKQIVHRIKRQHWLILLLKKFFTFGSNRH